MRLTLQLRDGASVVVNNHGTILYHSVTGKTYRHETLGSYAVSADWVKNKSAWRREVRYLTETVA